MYHKPTELLAHMDSHGIYDAAMLGECEFDTSTVPTYTPEQTQSQIQARGLGGWMDPDPAKKLINGWTTAEALARQFTGENPGAKYNGRGFAFRACVEALQEAGH